MRSEVGAVLLGYMEIVVDLGPNAHLNLVCFPVMTFDLEEH